MLDNIRYQQRLLTLLRHCGAAHNQGPLQALLYTLGEHVMDESATREFTKACMQIRRDRTATGRGAPIN